MESNIVNLLFAIGTLVILCLALVSMLKSLFTKSPAELEYIAWLRGQHAKGEHKEKKELYCPLCKI